MKKNTDFLINDRNCPRLFQHSFIFLGFFGRPLHFCVFPNPRLYRRAHFCYIKTGKSNRHPNRTDALPGASAGAPASCERPARTSAAGWPSRPKAADPPLAARPPTTHNSAAESAIRRPTMSAARRPARRATQAATPS